MDDPGLAWPYWKFGLSKDDLFSTLHDRYNTFASSIQDPEAFHHDVYEISHDASTADEFHRLLADRREQRLRELNDSLESAALEIIANPTLIGTEQWQHALQLFRSKSLDSLVRYFASYLPEDHSWHKPTFGSGSSASSSSSISDTISASSSTDDSLAESHPSLFDDGDYADESKPIVLTHEPLPISSSSLQSHLPPSPRSMTMCSEESSTTDDVAHRNYIFDSLTPARTLSFSESEPDHFPLRDSQCCMHHDDDALRQCCNAESPSTSVSSYEILEMKEEEDEIEQGKVTDDQPEVARIPTDESETPTPKPEHMPGSSFFDKMPSPIRRRHRSLSPSRHHSISQSRAHNSSHHRLVKQQFQRRACSPGTLMTNRRRHSPGESTARIQKPLPYPIRTRPNGRKWAEC